MSEISADSSPGVSRGVGGGSTPGQASFEPLEIGTDLGQPRRIDGLQLAGDGNAAARLTAQTKPRLSWYSTGLANLPSSIAVSHSDWATRNTATAVRTVKGAQRCVMKRLAASSAPRKALIDDLNALFVGPLAFGFHGLGQRPQIAAEGRDLVQL